MIIDFYEKCCNDEFVVHTGDLYVVMKIDLPSVHKNVCSLTRNDCLLIISCVHGAVVYMAYVIAII